MTVLEVSMFIGAVVAGLALGAIFFGGLWMTIRLTSSSAMFGLWLLGSFVLRMMIALAGIYFVFAGHWQRLIACLLGFVVARVIVARRLRPANRPNRAGDLGDPYAH
jgi:F1F0 ATPase subunit 2